MVRAESAEILVQWPAHRSTGVRPRGAQVRMTGGARRNPLSSRNARWAPRLAAFFYMRPPVPLPVCDRLFVPFPGPGRRLLPAPSESLKESPEMVRVIVDLEPLRDHLGDPTGRPEVC